MNQTELKSRKDTVAELEVMRKSGLGDMIDSTETTIRNLVEIGEMSPEEAASILWESLMERLNGLPKPDPVQAMASVIAIVSVVVANYDVDYDLLCRKLTGGEIGWDVDTWKPTEQATS